MIDLSARDDSVTRHRRPPAQGGSRAQILLSTITLTLLFLAVGYVGTGFHAAEAGAQTAAGDPVVARVGDEVIKLSDFEAAWERTSPAAQPQGKTELDSYQIFLEDYVISRILAIEAMKRPKKLLPSQEDDYQRLREQLLKNELYHIEVASTVNTDDVDFDLLLKEISEILVVRAFVFSELSTARSWSSKLSAGQPISSLEKAAEAANSGGPHLVELGLMRRESMSDTLAQALFHLAPGRCSDPIRFSEQWGLYQVTQVVPRPTKVDLNDPEQVIAEAVRLRVPQAREQYRTALRESLKVEYKYAALDTLAKRFAALPPRVTQSAGEAPSVNLALPLPTLNESDSALVLATTIEGDVTARDVIYYYARLAPHERREIRDRAEMITYVDRVAFDRELLRRAEALHLEERPVPKAHLKRRYEGYQVAFLYEDSVRTQVVIPEDSLVARFNANPDGYNSPASAQLWLTLTDTRQRADSLLAAARGGADLSSIALRFSLHEASAVNRGETGWITRGESENLEFDDLIFATADGEFAGPVGTQDGWVIFKVLEKRPAVTRDFEAARPYIRAAYEADAEERIVVAFLARLRERIPVETHPDRLAALVPQD